MPSPTTVRSSSKTFSALHNLAAFLLAMPMICLSLSVHAQAPAQRPAAPTVAGTPPAPAPTAKAHVADEGASLKNDAAHQGIKMHGHWKIDIKNPDGSLAEHREFENSIQNIGSNYLVGLMSGYASAGQYIVAINNASGYTNPCASNGYVDCLIVQSTAYVPGSYFCSTGNYCVTGLTVTPTFGTTPSLTFAGNVTALNNGSVYALSTLMSACGQTEPFGTYPTTFSTITPAACHTATATTTGSLSNSTLTSAFLASPISVVTGQIIQITVTLSFS